MFYAKVYTNKFILRLVRKESISDCILKFCYKLNIKNAYLTAIGAIESPTLSYYDIKSKKFLEKTLEGDYELTSFIGNISIFKNKPLLHAHVNLSDDKMRSFGGHFVKATVAASMEIVLSVFNTKYEKVFDPNTGLKLWNLPESI